MVRRKYRMREESLLPLFNGYDQTEPIEKTAIFWTDDYIARIQFPDSRGREGLITLRSRISKAQLAIVSDRVWFDPFELDSKLQRSRNRSRDLWTFELAVYNEFSGRYYGAFNTLHEERPGSETYIDWKALNKSYFSGEEDITEAFLNGHILRDAWQSKRTILLRLNLVAMPMENCSIRQRQMR